jgi:hypothetical protein
MVDGTVVIPVSFLEKYISGIRISRDSSGSISEIILEDDGALSDLTFLTGGISKQKVGNSYFGWSMDVPKGSKISSTSFNSKYILMENEQRAISLEVLLEAKEDRSLRNTLKKSLQIRQTI